MTKAAVVVRNTYVPHKRVFAPIFGVSRTRQEFAEECDINAIMKRYEKTGVLTHVREAQPRYLDLSDAPSFQDAMNLMLDAKAAFMTLPARVRKEFDNDPAKFVEFAEKPENLEQMGAWGLADPAKVADPPMRVEVVNSAPASPDGRNEPVKGS